jgi:hypothetical protein
MNYRHQPTGWAPQALWQAAAVASSRGVLARACGITGAENPYLLRLDVSLLVEAGGPTWLGECNAWWRGWDEEDERRRIARH